ncbi:Ff.00g114390.m01.CDS01 [Fusarium sp. VM40]|nr:Ff.00g114390.m01.CDS01 [Fusarium sp. VM40]
MLIQQHFAHLLELARLSPVSTFFTLAILIISFQVLRLRLSPVRRFPGPVWAKLSSFWLASQCRRTRRSEAVMQLHKKYGDFVRIGPNHISINNPIAVTEIYGHGTGFTKSTFYDAFLQVTPVVFNARNVAEHTRKKRYASPAFSTRALSEFEPYMDLELVHWKNKLLSMADHTGTTEVDFVIWSNFLAFDVISSFAFGEPFGFIGMAEDPYHLIETIDARGEVMNAIGTLSPYLRSLVKYYPFDSFWSSGMKARANFEKFGRQAYQRRKSAAESRKDLLSFLFSATDPDTANPLEENEIVAESISFIVGGSDTTSSTMANFIDFVSRDPDLQSQLQQEIDTVFPGYPDENWVPSEKKAAGLPLLVATLREVMRLRPTSATGLERITPPGGRIIAGEYIPGKTVVSVPTVGIMMDPKVFDSPEEFKPHRWLELNSKKLLGSFFPFSTGPRACIGRNFAWMEILKAMVIIFKLFDIRRLNSNPTVIREGFFNKAAECNTEIRLRKFT